MGTNCTNLISPGMWVSDVSKYLTDTRTRKLSTS